MHTESIEGKFNMRSVFSRSSGALILGLTVALLFLSAPANAQDAHYWTDQFGNRALLLAGAVVGDPADLSAVYYNPGGLALMETPEAFLAGLSVKFSDLTITDAVQPSGDLTTSGTSLTPSLIAGEIPLLGPRHRLAYSLLTRYDTRADGLAKNDSSGDTFALPTIALVSDAFRFAHGMSEHWVGGTYAYEASDNFGIGATLFLAVRNQSGQSQDLLQVLTTDNLALVSDISTGFTYRHWRVLSKIGVAGRFLDWNVGVTLTTPSLGNSGGGSTFNNFTLVGQTLTPEGAPLTEIATDVQSGLAAEYRSPVSLAGGASRTFGATTVHFSAEWFRSVDLYTVLDSQPFQSQTSDRTVDTAVRQELNSVVNVAIGLEHVFNPGLKAYAGFHTDFSALARNSQSNLSLALWDVYHISGGATFRAVGQDFTLGANLAFGGGVIDKEEAGDSTFIGLPDKTDVSVQQITVLLGFNFDFGG